MITTINEFKKINENSNAENIWNTMSLNAKEEKFGDEFDIFFDSEDKYLKNVADKFFTTKWKDLKPEYQNRIIELI